MRTTFSSLMVLPNSQLHLYLLMTSQSQIKASSKSHHTHLWPLPRLPSSPQVPWLLQEGKPAVQRGRHLWYTSVAPARCDYTALHKGLISASSALPSSGCSSTAPAWGTRWEGLLEWFISPISYQNECFWKGYFPFINAHLEQYLLEEILSTLEAVLVASVQPRG